VVLGFALFQARLAFLPMSASTFRGRDSRCPTAFAALLAEGHDCAWFSHSSLGV
jgi:hypothetical protein